MERRSHPELAALALIMACCVAFAARGVDAQGAAPPPVDCSSAITLLIPCLDFVTGTAPTPSPDCCSGLKTILNTNPICLCQILGSQAGSGSGINMTLALELPKFCQISGTDPNRCSGPGPAPAPQAPVPSPVEAPVPTPSITPVSPPIVPPASPPTVTPSTPPPTSPPTTSPPPTTPPASPPVTPPPSAAPVPVPASETGPTPSTHPVASPPVAVPAPSPDINATQTPEAGVPSEGQAPPPSVASTFTPSIWIYMGLATVSAFLNML